MKSSLHHAFDPYLAAEHGLHEAILIHHFQFWIHFNLEKGNNFIDGRTWTFQTMENIAAHFPYLSRDQVKRTLRSLIEQGVIQKARFNKIKMDRTNWYSFVNEKNFIIGRNRPMVRAESPDGSGGIARAIPYNKQHAKQHAKKDNVPPTPQRGGSVSSSKKEEKSQPFPKSAEECISRYKMTTEQAYTLIWLTELEGLNTDLRTLSWWAKTYHPDRLENVYKYAKKRSRKSIGALMNKLLKTESVIETEEVEENRKFAENFKKERGWNELDVMKKYAVVRTGTGYGHEINFNMGKKDFARMLQRKYDSFV